MMSGDEKVSGVDGDGDDDDDAMVCFIVQTTEGSYNLGSKVQYAE